MRDAGDACADACAEAVTAGDAEDDASGTPAGLGAKPTLGKEGKAGTGSGTKPTLGSGQEGEPKVKPKAESEAVCTTFPPFACIAADG